MYQPYPTIKPLKSDEVLWRYFPLEKFTWLLEDNALYLCRADLFLDTYEGVVPGGSVENTLRELPTVAANALTALHNANRGYMFVSCWHSNHSESLKMWEQYSSLKEGIAIKTTARRLQESLIGPESCVIGRVDYVDHAAHDNIDGDSYKNLLIKREKFIDEQEVRVIHFSGGPKSGIITHPIPPDPREGIKVAVNFATLFERLILSPKADSKFTQKLEALLAHHKVSNKLQKSELNL